MCGENKESEPKSLSVLGAGRMLAALLARGGETGAQGFGRRIRAGRKCSGRAEGMGLNGSTSDTGVVEWDLRVYGLR